jgi:hypothetical protein
MSDHSPMRDPLDALLAPAARAASDLPDLPDVVARLEQANVDGDAPAFRARVLEAVESGDISPAQADELRARFRELREAGRDVDQTGSDPGATTGYIGETEKNTSDDATGPDTAGSGTPTGDASHGDTGTTGSTGGATAAPVTPPTLWDRKTGEPMDPKDPGTDPDRDPGPKTDPPKLWDRDGTTPKDPNDPKDPTGPKDPVPDPGPKIEPPPIATERIWDHPRDEDDLGHGDDDIDVTRPPVLQSAATDSAAGGIDTSGGGLGEVLPELPDPESYVLDDVPAYVMSDPAEEPALGHTTGGLDDAGM